MRDVRLVRDLALSHVLSRDQILSLGYFGSVTRANTRLRALVAQRLINRLTTPFYNQSLYGPGALAAEVAGERIAPLVADRAKSPRFVQHALSVTNVRIALLEKGAVGWRFEQQLWREVAGRTLKPDGLVMTTTLPAFVEVDLGHVAPAKFKEKLKGYAVLDAEGICEQLYGFAAFRLLVVTTTTGRARQLRSLLPAHAGFECLFQPFKDLGVSRVESWS